MPAIDYCQPQIIRALEKEGWRVEDKPFRAKLGRRTIHIDIEASRQVNGTQQRIMLAEVKCFPDLDNTTRDLYTAIGQYLVYRAMLVETEIHVPLYLAIPESIYRLLFDKAIQRAMNDSRIKLLIVDLEAERIVQWIES